MDEKKEKLSAIRNFNYFMALYNIYSSLEHDFETNHSVSCPEIGKIQSIPRKEKIFIQTCRQWVIHIIEKERLTLLVG